MKREDVVKKRSLAWIVTLAAVPLLLHLPIVSAAEPAIVWSAPGMQEGFFSKDGAWAVLTGNSSAGGRIEVRSAGTGALVSALANALGFTAVALTRDKQIIAGATAEAVSGKHGSVTFAKKIYLYRVSDGAFLRSISTDAKASIGSLDFSPDGQFIASMDELAYGSGGRVRVFRVATGALVPGPAVGSKSTAVEFSPDGQFLAANDASLFANGIAGGVRIFRTSNWTTVMTVAGGDKLVHWSPDGGSIWTRNHWDGSTASTRRISVPAGTVSSLTPTFDYSVVQDVTPDARLLLADRAVVPQNALRFIDTASGAVVL